MIYDYLHYYQNALQTPTLNAGLTRRYYGVHAARPQRTHGALEDPTTLPHRSHRALSNRLCKRRAAAFILSMLKTNAAAWCSRRLLSPHTALLATAQRTPRRSETFRTLWERCKDATLV